MATIGWDLLAKYLNKETTEEEIRQIDTWRKESADNEAYFKKISRVWQESEKDLLTSIPETDKVWQQLSQQIEADPVVDTGGAKTVKIFNWFSVSGIAATILLLILAGVAIWYLTGNNRYLEVNTLAQADSVLLPDGSLVHLNANSTLKYARNFDGEKREVVLQGEAFFDVVRNPNQPFVVGAGEAKLTVLGTSFNIKAPENKSAVSCIVLSGKVQMQVVEKEEIKVILTRDEEGVYDNEQLSVNPFNDTNAIGWYTGEFTFQQNTLAEMVQVLEDAYHQEIVLQNPDLANCTLTANFRGNNLEEMLQVITITLGLQFEKQDIGWIITGEGC